MVDNVALIHLTESNTILDDESYDIFPEDNYKGVFKNIVHLMS